MSDGSRARRTIALVLSVAAIAVAGTRDKLRPVPETATIAAVGDIACGTQAPSGGNVCRHDAVARTITASGYDRVLLLGDIQYDGARYPDYVRHFDEAFGEIKERLAPTPGNHDHDDPGAAGYYRYFGGLAPGPTYSFDLATWHLVSIDSQGCGPVGELCQPGFPTYDWLEADLVAHPARCTLAFWHHPRWGWIGGERTQREVDSELRRTQPLWDLLYRHHMDVVLAGHHHAYSRWLPADPQGRHDPERGITQYVVGTGGRSLQGFGDPADRPEIFATGQAEAYGYLELELHPAGWEFRWVSAPGEPAFVDAGSGTCH